MGGNTRQAASPDNVTDALKAMTAARDAGQAELATVTGERDQALADLAAHVGERDALAARIFDAGFAPEGEWDVVEQAIVLVGHLATMTAEREAAGVSAVAVMRRMIEHDLQPKAEGEWDVDARTIELLDQFAGIRDRLIGVNAELAELGLLPDGPVEPVEFASMLAQRFRALTAERDGAVADLAIATTATDKVKADLKAAKTKAGPKSAKARAIGPLADGQPSGEDLLTLIGAAETVELVFSDGKKEITALAPQLIEGDAWYQAAFGVRLRLPSLLIHGPGRDDAAFRLAGYGLVLDGELTAWAARMDVLTVQPGGQYELKDDVIFG